MHKDPLEYTLLCFSGSNTARNCLDASVTSDMEVWILGVLGEEQGGGNGKSQAYRRRKSTKGCAVRGVLFLWLYTLSYMLKSAVLSCGVHFAPISTHILQHTS